MTRLDFDGLDGSLMVPAFNQDTAELATLERTQDEDAGDAVVSPLTISALFVAGILIGVVSMLAWWSIDKEMPLVRSADKPSGPILQRETAIEPFEPAEAIVLPSPPEHAEKDVPMISDEQQVFASFQSADEGNATDQSFSQAQDNLVMDRTKPEQEIDSSQSQSVSLQDKTDSNEQKHQASPATTPEPEPSDITGDEKKAEDAQLESSTMPPSAQTTEQQPDAGSGSNPPVAPVAELEQTPSAVDAGRDDMARQSQQINYLMATAYMQIMMKKLTLPEGDNALESYRKVLELQPQHQEARDGIENIRSIYISWADTAQRRDEWENAELFLSRALRITPSDTELNEALRQVREEKTAYLSREAEAARIGAVEAEAEPALKAPQALPATFPEVISIQNVKHEALTAGNSARALIQATVNGKASRVEVFVEFNKQVTSYEMNESGSSGEKRLPNDFLYTREIPLRYSAEGTKYVVAAYKQDGTVIYSPQGNIIEPLLQGPAVVINEFMVANTQTIADPQGDYDDWIELYNRTFRTVDLSGYYLSDDKGNPKKWKFPPGTTIGGYGYLLVWADGEAQYTGVGHSGFELHTNFQLSKSGEYVLLVDSDANENKILDGTIYDRQPSDFSVSRYPNGVGEFSVSSVPTPGIKN